VKILLKSYIKNVKFFEKHLWKTWRNVNVLKILKCCRSWFYYIQWW